MCLWDSARADNVCNYHREEFTSLPIFAQKPAQRKLAQTAQ